MKYADITSKYYTWPKLKPVRSIIWCPECGAFGPPRHSIVASVVGILLVLPGELNTTQHTTQSNSALTVLCGKKRFPHIGPAEHRSPEVVSKRWRGSVNDG